MALLSTEQCSTAQKVLKYNTLTATVVPGG